MNEIELIKTIRRGQSQKALVCLRSLIFEKIVERKMSLLKEAGMPDRKEKIRSKLSSLTYGTLKFKTKEEFDSKVKELTDSGADFDQYPDKMQIKILTSKS